MINNIQFLRALAAIMVVAYHSSDIVSKYGFEFNGFLDVGYWGAFGVDIFFVISGYIMAMIDDEKHKTPYKFAMDRIIRIVPVYWVLTSLIIAMQALIPSVFRDSIYEAPQNIASLLFVSEHLGYKYPTLYVGWTLELEMFFYATFTACLFIKGKASKLVVLSTVITVLSVFSVIKPVAMEFVFGILVYYLSKMISIRNTSKLPSSIFFLVVLTAFWCLFYFDIPSERESILRPLQAGLVSFFVVISAIICRDMRSNIFTRIGDASYSLYLIQVFTIPLIAKVILKAKVITNGYLVFGTSIFFTVVVGWLFYYLFEKRLVSCLRKLTSARFTKRQMQP
nr:acyltransferase [Pantoea cypripedii]